MYEEIRSVLAEINPEFETYEGDNLFEDMEIDSHDIFNVVVALEDAFGIEIDPVFLKMENFMSFESIAAMIERIKNS